MTSTETAETRGTDTRLIYAPLRVRINAASIAFFAGFMVVAFFGALVSWALGSPLGFLIVALPVLFPAGWAMRRATRVRLVASKEGVLIDNTWRSYELSWPEVEGVGIRLTGLLPQPVLWFRRVGRSPVVAQASPVRRSARQKFQTEVLAFAPASVLRLEDEAAAGWIGSDSAASYKLRLWWLHKHPQGRWARLLDRFGS